MKRNHFNHLLLIVTVLFGASLTNIREAQAAVTLTFSPSPVQLAPGSSGSTQVTVAGSSLTSTSSVDINSISSVPDGIIIYNDQNPFTTVDLDANGRATLSIPTLSTAGTYTVDVCFYATGSNDACDEHRNAFTINVAAASAGTGTPPAATTGSSAAVELPNPIACSDATCLIGQVVRYILGSIAVVATLMFVWGGVMMLTSGGNADQVKRAKETLVWAAIGVVVILISWLIIKTVLQALTNTSS